MYKDKYHIYFYLCISRKDKTRHIIITNGCTIFMIYHYVKENAYVYLFLYNIIKRKKEFALLNNKCST